MSVDLKSLPRLVRAVHGKSDRIDDPPYHHQLAEELKAIYGPAGLIELYGRFSTGTGFVDGLMRKVIWQALARQCGTDLRVASGAAFKHPETFEIGHGVHIDTQTYLQGRHDGTCVIGNKVWIGPQAYLDARDLVLEDYVGWGPGAKIVGSTHTGVPHDLPIIATDLEIRPVRVGAWADIGANATLLPGVRIGKGAIVGAGAVVVNDVEPFSVVAGVPARFLRWRKDSDSTAATP